MNTTSTALSRLNFRDVGGMKTAAGVVRTGVLYRSEGPASFLDVHRIELAKLGFRTVCDLRSAGERRSAPNDWCGPDCQVLAVDMNTDLRAKGASIWNSLRDDPSPENAARVMAQNYRLMPEALLSHWSIIADALVRGAVPMLMHCTAGKDRTGVAMALILSVLGVPIEQIHLDYARSEVFGRNRRIAASVEDSFIDTFGFAPAAPTIAALLGAREEFLLAAFEETTTRWGSVPEYFAAAGIDARRQEQLRDALIDNTRSADEASMMEGSA